MITSLKQSAKLTKPTFWVEGIVDTGEEIRYKLATFAWSGLKVRRIVRIKSKIYMSKCFTKEDGSSNPMIICISFGRKHQFCLIIVTVNWSSRWQLDAKSILASSSPLLRETAENWRFFLLFRNCVINPDPCPWNWGLTRPTNKWKWVCPFPASRCIFIRLVTENFDEGVGIHGEHSWCLYSRREYLDKRA